MEGLSPEDTLAVPELDPLACEFTDPFVQPLARVTRLAPAFVCWLWLSLFAVIEVALERGAGLV